jgi:type II secretory pathway pseudopilin PulG
MIGTNRNATPRGTHPAGFTLLEILLAMGLAVILLAVIGQALYMYGQYSTIGRAQVTRSQLARAILKRMETDIRSVVYRPPEEEGNEAAQGQAADEGAAQDADEEVIEPELQDPTDAYATGSMGVIGTADQLVLHISAPSRDLNYSSVLDGETLNARTSDLQSVSWFLAVSGADGLPGAAADLAAETPSYTASNGESQGLSRLAGDRMTMNFADAESDLVTLVQSTNLLAPEVTFLQFRYFDGVDWLEDWDSDALGGLPKSIEIIIGFDPLDAETTNTQQPKSPFADRTAAKSETYRLVVALPLAQPYIAELEF